MIGVFEMQAFTDDHVPIVQRRTVPGKYGGILEIEPLGGLAYLRREA